MSSATQIVVFVMFGIGVDDALIISGSYKRTDPSKDPVERMDDTIDDIGLSIGLTTLTSALAFAMGCISSIPCVYWLCYYAFPTVIIIFFYQTGFFVALTVIDERRLQANRYDILVCYTASNANEDTAAARDDNHMPPEPTDDDSKSIDKQAQQQKEQLSSIESPHSEPSPSREKQGFLTDGFMEWYAGNLLRPWVKAAVIIAFVALLIGCVYSTTKLRQYFNFRDLLPNDSYVHDFFYARATYCANTADINAFIYFRTVDQTDPLIQQQMEDYVNDLVEAEAIARQPSYFWLRHFHMFIDQLNNNTHTQQWVANATFSEQLDAFLNVPIFGALYRENIVRDPETGSILASRCDMEVAVDLDDSGASIDKLADFRDTSAAQPINMNFDGPVGDAPFFCYRSYFHMWEFFDTVVGELITTTIFGVVAVSLVALLFIPHWTAIVFVFPCISTLYVDLLGKHSYRF
jgi:hypothetical protein